MYTGLYLAIYYLLSTTRGNTELMTDHVHNHTYVHSRTHYKYGVIRKLRLNIITGLSKEHLQCRRVCLCIKMEHRRVCIAPYFSRLLLW